MALVAKILLSVEWSLYFHLSFNVDELVSFKQKKVVNIAKINLRLKNIGWIDEDLEFGLGNLSTELGSILSNFIFLCLQNSQA